MVALPLAPAAGVNVSVPSALMAGPAENRAALLLLVIWKVTVCHRSFAGPAEMAGAQPANVCGPEPSRTVLLGPAVNVGGWLTGLTVMRNRCGALTPPLSWSTTVIAAMPLASLAGVKVRVPLAAMSGPALNKLGLVLPVTWNANPWPEEIPVAHPTTVCGPEFSLTATSGPSVKDGASLMVAVKMDVPTPPSLSL